MNLTTCITTFVFLSLLIPSSPGSAEKANPREAQGRKVAQKAYDRPKGDTSVGLFEMVLEPAKGKPKSRKLYIYGLNKEAGKKPSLVRFISPESIKNTGLLTLPQPGDDDNQWLYLPALNKSRRISSSRKGGKFVGSDIYYEDLQDRVVAKDKHVFKGKQKLNGQEVYVIESTPVKKSNSAYSKRISWVHPQTYIAVRIDFYEGSEAKPSKRMTVNKIEKKQGYWTVMSSTTTDLKTNHKTHLKALSIKYDTALPDTFFARSTLEDPRREAKYRK